MNQQIWIQIEEVLGDALQLPPQERSRFLQQQLAGQPEALEAAESILSTEEEAESLFSQSPLEAWQIGPGMMLGPWRLERLLGSGGMGSVWFAQRIDGQARMDAAIKILPPALAGPLGANSSLRRRFLSEKYILSQLQHPNIARLLDAGTGTDEIPNFVMEFVDGTPLSVFPVERLSRAERLSMFVKVCEAIEYAHAKLIVHRDLKPHNIIIQPNGEPKLLDFGLAGILSDQPTDGSMTLYRAFSVDYASPEQLCGEPMSTASDIYSLGLILYEILMGKRARTWTHLNTMEAARCAATYEIPADPLLDRDFFAVLRQASHPEPGRRYRSVSEFLADVQRLRQDLPVLARNPGAAERAVRFLRRNWLAASATAAIIGVIGTTSYSAFSASHLAQERSQQLERALTAERAALSMQQLALEAAQRESRRANQSASLAARSQSQSEERFREILKIFNNTFDHTLRRVVQLPGGTKAGFELLSTSLVELERLSPGPRLLEDMLYSRARAHTLLRDLANGPNSNLGDAAASKKHGEASYALYEELHRLRPTVVQYHSQMLFSGVRLDVGQLKDPRRREYWQKQFMSLTQAAPNDAEAWAALGYLQFQSGTQLREMERRHSFEASIRSYLRALSITPNSLQYLRNVALGHKYLSNSKELQASEALHHASEAVRFDREINRLRPEDAPPKLDLAFSLSALGDAEMRSGGNGAAIAFHRESFQIRRNLFKEDPTNARLRKSIAYPAYRWAVAAFRCQQFDEFEKAIAAFDALPEDVRSALVEGDRSLLENVRSLYASRP